VRPTAAPLATFGARNTLNPSALPEMDAADLKTTLRLGKNEVLHEAVAGEAELCNKDTGQHEASQCIFKI